jgi:methionyl aminopeptidase
MIKPKTDKEIEHLKEGGERLAGILHELKSFVEVGLPVKEINEKAKQLIPKGDTAAFYQYQPTGAPTQYPDHVCVSINDEIVHGIGSDSDYVLADGDVVSLDMGLTHEDLITDSAITFVVGESDEQKDALLGTCQNALQAGIEKAQVGNFVGDISAAIQEVIGDEYAIFRQLVGHGVGYSVHEKPTIPNFGRAGDGLKLPTGAVIAIEPMIGVGEETITQDNDGYTYRTTDESLSAHFEHTVAVTEGGPCVLTKPVA